MQLCLLGSQLSQQAPWICTHVAQLRCCSASAPGTLLPIGLRSCFTCMQGRLLSRLLHKHARQAYAWAAAEFLVCRDQLCSGAHEARQDRAAVGDGAPARPASLAAVGSEPRFCSTASLCVTSIVSCSGSASMWPLCGQGAASVLIVHVASPALAHSDHRYHLAQRTAVKKMQGRCSHLGVCLPWR